jgi:thiaminase (transcriptional activator TenA)
VLAFLLFAASLTDEMWTEAKPVYQATLQHPYLQGLADGTLPKPSFQFYLIEDAKYLRAFGEALRALAKKAPQREWAATLGRHATEAIDAEKQLHQSLLASYGLAAGKPDGPMAPTNYAYTNHFRQTVEKGSFAEGLAAMLPCYWIYWEVGKELVKRGSKDKDYQRWIDQYASEGYGATVRQVLDMMNIEAGRLTPQQRRRAIDLFVVSTRYEYMFWDMAWRREPWPPATPAR